MNASEMTFGIEIECYVPRGLVLDGTIRIGGYHAGAQVNALPMGWNCQHDGSLRGVGCGRVGVEIVSPILKGADGIQQVKLVCKWLQSIGATVRSSCGFHVHVGFDPTNSEGLKQVVSLVANFEKALYASTGTKSREQGHYCRTVQGSTVHKNGEYNRAERYHLLNVSNLVRGGKPTVEFRCFAGTINLVKILGHIRQCLGLVEKALSMKKLPKWEAKTPVVTSPIHRGGEGLTALTRFFYTLGWTKGRSDYVFGNVEADGCPGIKACKKVLQKLAKKYDAVTV